MENSIYQLKKGTDEGDIREELFSCINQIQTLSEIMHSGGDDAFGHSNINLISSYGELLRNLSQQASFLIHQI